MPETSTYHSERWWNA